MYGSYICKKICKKISLCSQSPRPGWNPDFVTHDNKAGVCVCVCVLTLLFARAGNMQEKCKYMQKIFKA